MGVSEVDDRITFEPSPGYLSCTGTVGSHEATRKILVDGRWHGDATCDDPEDCAEAIAFALDLRPRR